MGQIAKEKMNNLSHQLFHGTIESLPEGSLISPLHKGANAWATSDLNYAIKHTSDRVSTGLGLSSEGQHPHHGNVYEVEPIEGDESLKIGRAHV